MPRLSPTKIERLRAEPHAAELLDALADEPGVYLVGGAVRDLLLAERIVDFDFTVVGDAVAVARRVGKAVGAELRSHPRFGTATLHFKDGTTVDFATTRSEKYSQPGALPDVAAGDLAQDLARRDFSANAIALAVYSVDFGEIVEFAGATRDIQAKLLRVLNERSFLDDPTRLLRLLRYGARLGFAAEPHTEDLARAAVAENALRRVVGSRVRDELLDLLGERQAVVSIDLMATLGLDQQLHDRFFADEYVAARAVMHLRDGIRQDLVLLAACCRGFPEDELRSWLASIELTRAEIKTVIDAATNSQSIADALEAARAPSEIDAALAGHAPEAVVVASALPGVGLDVQQRAADWLAHESDGLLISGRHLIDAGVAPGPQIGRALARVAADALDGKLTTEAGQLEAALRWAREGAGHGDD